MTRTFGVHPGAVSTAPPITMKSPPVGQLGYLNEVPLNDSQPDYLNGTIGRVFSEGA